MGAMGARAAGMVPGRMRERPGICGAGNDTASILGGRVSSKVIEHVEVPDACHREFSDALLEV